MKKAKWILFFLIIATLLFVGCAKTPAPVNGSASLPKPDVSKGEEVLDSTKDAEPPELAEEVHLTVELATDENLSTYDSFTEFIEFDDEGYQKIIITTNIAVEDFKFIEIGFEEKDSDIIFLESEVLYYLEELTPEEPFLVTWMEWGSFPHRGISFIDETGATRHFYLGMSGEDGSLYLAEF